MGNELMEVNDTIDVQRVTDLSKSLSNLSTKKYTFSLLPNILKEVAEIALDRKKLSVMEEYLVWQHEESSKQMDCNYDVSIKKLKIELVKIEKEHMVAFRKIESDTEIEQEKISKQHYEKIKELELGYDVKLKQIDMEFKLFKSALEEEGHRFNKQYGILVRQQKNREKIQQEVLKGCEQMRKKGKLDSTYIDLMKIALDASKPDFDILTTVNKVFSYKKRG